MDIFGIGDGEVREEEASLPQLVARDLSVTNNYWHPRSVVGIGVACGTGASWFKCNHILRFLFKMIKLFSQLVKPTDYVDPDGALNHLHKIPYHLSLLGSSESL